MGVFASCPAPFHYNSREQKPVDRLRRRIKNAARPLDSFTSRCVDAMPACAEISRGVLCYVVYPCVCADQPWSGNGSGRADSMCDESHTAVANSQGNSWISLPMVLALLDAEEAEIIRTQITEQREEMFKTFPGLINFGDMTPEQIEEKIKHDSLLTGERGRFKRIVWLMLTAGRELPKGLVGAKREKKLLEIRERRLLEAYRQEYALNGMSFKTFKSLTHKAIERTHKYIDEMLQYVPLNHRMQLEFAARVRSAKDFPTLIQLITARIGDGVIAKRIPHEARVVAVLAQIEFEHMIGAYNPDRVGDVHTALIKVFEDDVFDSSERVTVVAELDPDKRHSVRRDADGKPMISVYHDNQPEAHQKTTSARVVMHLDARVVKGPGEGSKPILVYFDDRVKEMIFAKLMRKLKRMPEHITDHSGVTLVCLSDGPEVELLVDRLRFKLVTNPGQVWAQKSNAARAGAIDPANPHSSVDRRGETYLFRWGGITHELQMLDLATYIESIFCRDRRAHTLYKFLTLIDTAFPFIWPQCYYNKDWMDAELRDVFWEYAIGKLWTGPPNPTANDNQSTLAAA